jgi:hypothetical protein
MRSERNLCSGSLALLLAAVWLCGAAGGQEPAPQAADKAQAGAARVVVLDTTGFWRLHHTLKPPVIRFVDGVRAIEFKQTWLARETPEPPPDWRQVGFDDSAWLRGPARIACRTPLVSRLCLRGKFTVTDPGKVEGLALSVSYQGGAIVYVNGRELARGHVAAEVDPVQALAEGYPSEAFVKADGSWLLAWDVPSRPDAETARRLALRERRLAGIQIPRERLRKGLNVIALEIVRASYHQIVDEEKDATQVKLRGSPYDLAFNTCEFDRVQLTASGAAGLVPNAIRPEGLQVWNSDILTADFDMDFGDQAEPLYPIRLVGPRNGSFSGKVVVGSTKPIQGLRATAGDLRASGAAIPAAAVRIRYALPWGDERGVYSPHFAMCDNKYPRYPLSPALLAALVERPLAEFPVPVKRPGTYDLKTPGQPAPVLGAVVPIWVTVSVPKEARAGRYEGQVAIEVQGEQPVKVPLRLEVVDWTLPDTQDRQTWVELIQSPDTLAVEYGAPLWSQEHFDLIARSLGLIGETGSRVLYIPLIAHTNLGNAESMVRWIRKGEGQYEYDFSAMDRYLDVAERHMGRPKIVCFVLWDIYLCPKKQIKDAFDPSAIPEAVKARQALRGKGPLVTVLDPATQKTENVHLPLFTDPSSRGLWQPLLAQLRERMKKRGLEQTMMLGFVSDAWPVAEEDQLFKEISGGLPWVAHAHLGVRHNKTYGGPHFQNCPINTAYETRIVNVSFASEETEFGSLYGWRQPELIAQHERHAAEFPASRWRLIGELNITGRQRGIGRLGADFWRAVKNKDGHRVGTVDDRYPESSWRNLNMVSALLAPGPDGPVATYRFEALREGLQECAARIFLERALTDEALKARLGGDLTARCRELLVERTDFMLKACANLQLAGPSHNYVTNQVEGTIRRPGTAGHYWFAGSGWQERSRKLYALAAEVQQKLSE